MKRSNVNFLLSFSYPKPGASVPCLQVLILRGVRGKGQSSIRGNLYDRKFDSICFDAFVVPNIRSITLVVFTYMAMKPSIFVQASPRCLLIGII